MMSKIKYFYTILAILSGTLFINAQLHAAGKVANPSGKPFVELNGYIHEVEGAISSLQDQINTLVAKVDTIEERVTANENAILDLNTKNVYLQSQIDANATDIATLGGKIATLETANSNIQRQIDTLGDADGSLQAQIDTNKATITSTALALDTIKGDFQSQIDNNNHLIMLLQAEIQDLNEAIDLRQMIISGNCPQGQAVRQINTDGSVVCELITEGTTVPGSLTTYHVYNQTNVSPGQTMNVLATCPEGTVLTGGGYMDQFAFGRSNDRPAFYSQTGQTTNTDVSHRQWFVRGHNNSSYTTPLLVTAICLKLN